MYSVEPMNGNKTVCNVILCIAPHNDVFVSSDFCPTCFILEISNLVVPFYFCQLPPCSPWITSTKDVWSLELSLLCGLLPVHSTQNGCQETLSFPLQQLSKQAATDQILEVYLCFQNQQKGRHTNTNKKICFQSKGEADWRADQSQAQRPRMCRYYYLFSG